MNYPFPFGFPPTTAFYFVLYVATWILHVVFMNYVLAGAAWLAWTSVIAGKDGGRLEQRPLATVLRDWLPFVLSAAITAGIAPLLFVQIVYQSRFYTANLLLFPRWMGILPAIMFGFYLLYALKSRALAQSALWIRILTALGALMCFVFTAYSWTENHLVSIHSTAWPEIYATGTMPFSATQLLLRLAVWFSSAFAIMAIEAAWQLWLTQRRYPTLKSRESADTESGVPVGRISSPAIGSSDVAGGPDYKSGLQGNEKRSTGLEPLAGESRTLAHLALGSRAVMLVFAIGYVITLDAGARWQLVSAFAGPYLLVLFIGLGLETYAWLTMRKGSGFAVRPLVLASLGSLLTLLGLAVSREAVRLSQVPIESLYPQHAAAGQIGGFGLFLTFLVINVALIGWCILTACRARPEEG